MMSAVLIVLLFILAWIAVNQTEGSLEPFSQKISDRIQRLWDVAQGGIRDKKYLRAEKALLTILKIDKTNASAYNRLGILYSKQKEYKDAIECFEIATSIKPVASSYHNLGLIYFETENYEKAAQAFEQALELEDGMADRHIAYAKTMEKQDKYDQVVESLKTAIKLEPRPQTFKMLADVYEKTGEKSKAKNLNDKLETLLKKSKKKRVFKGKRRVVY